MGAKELATVELPQEADGEDLAELPTSITIVFGTPLGNSILMTFTKGLVEGNPADRYDLSFASTIKGGLSDGAQTGPTMWN